MNSIFSGNARCQPVTRRGAAVSLWSVRPDAMKKPKIIRDEWRVLSNKFVRHQRLPYGTRVVLEHASTVGSKGRKARNDLTISRKLFNGRASDSETVSELLDNYLAPTLLVDIERRGLRLKLVGPNGEEPNGNTRLKTMRKWPALPAPDELEAAEMCEAEVEEISRTADADIRTAEEFRDDSEIVLQGFIRALVRR
jgi:hypothetical protein